MEHTPEKVGGRGSINKDIVLKKKKRKEKWKY